MRDFNWIRLKMVASYMRGLLFSHARNWLLCCGCEQLRLPAMHGTDRMLDIATKQA
jgi:hypothetical protein